MAKRLTKPQCDQCRSLAAQVWVDVGGDLQLARQEFNDRVRKVGLSPAMIILFVRLAWILFQFWYGRQVVDPGSRRVAGEPVGLPVEEPDPKALWGTPPPKKVAGAYEHYDHGQRFSFGPKEAGSMFANAMTLQPIFITMSYEIERMTDQVSPGVPVGLAGVGAWASQMMVFLLMRTLASLLRNYGSGWARDFGAWAWAWIIEYFKSFLPGYSRRKQRRERREDREDSDGEGRRRKRKKRPLVDWLLGR